MFNHFESKFNSLLFVQNSDRVLLGSSCAGGSCISVTNVRQADGGAYMCTADNGVGTPHTANIFLTVQCKSSLYLLCTLLV